MGGRGAMASRSGSNKPATNNGIGSGRYVRMTDTEIAQSVSDISGTDAQVRYATSLVTNEVKSAESNAAAWYDDKEFRVAQHTSAIEARDAIISEAHRLGAGNTINALKDRQRGATGQAAFMSRMKANGYSWEKGPNQWGRIDYTWVKIK